MIWVLSLWLLVIAGLFLVLWVRSAKNAGAKPSLPMLLLVPLVVLAAVGAWRWIGMNAATPQWLAEYQANHQLVRDMVRGAPDEAALKDVPLQTLVRVLQRELALSPSAEGWYGLSMMYGDMQAADQAVIAARKAVRLAPEESAAKLLLARSLINAANGQLVDEAREQIDAVLAVSPQHDGAWMMLAMGAMQSADYPLAIQAFDELLSRHSEGEAAQALAQARAEAVERQKNLAWLADVQVEVSAGEGIQPGGTLFVFLRRPGEKGQPLAAVRLLADRFPLTVPVEASHWLQAPPAPGTALVAGARYTPAPGQGVDQAAISAENQPLGEQSGGLRATLQLR